MNYWNSKYPKMLVEYLRKDAGEYPLAVGYNADETREVIKRLNLENYIRVRTQKGVGFLVRSAETWIQPTALIPGMQEPRKPKRKIEPINENYSVVGQDSGYVYTGPVANPSGKPEQVASYYDGIWARLRKRYGQY
jgi:hypothetical protein